MQSHSINVLTPPLTMEAIARRFSSAATTYDEHAIFQQEIATRLVERLSWFNQRPQTVLDIGAGTGHLTTLIKKVYPEATIIGIDIAKEMVKAANQRHQTRWWQTAKHHFIAANGHALPFKANTFDLVISNCTLQWCNPLKIFQEVKQVLKPEGLFLFTSLGPDTLVELRTSFKAADNAHHVHPFMDMHNVGDLLLKAGFLDPVMDRENLTMLYENINMLCRDLKQTGANNLHEARTRGLTGRASWEKMKAYYHEHFVTEPAQIPATIEVIYGHAFHPKRIPTAIGTQAVVEAQT